MSKTERTGTLVKVTIPQEPAKPTIQNLAVGTYFKIKDDQNVYVKTDETLGRGYRCFRTSDGHLVPISFSEVAEKVYSCAEILVK